MKKQKRFRKKFMSTLLFSLVAAVVLIIHGVFFDLEFSQISRLTTEGFFITFILVFMGLLILEHIFTLEEDEAIAALKRRVSQLEKKKR